MNFLEYLCSQYPLLVILHAAGWIGAVLNAGSLFFTDESGTAIVMLNFVAILVLITWTGVVIRKCRQIDPADD